MNRLSQIDFLKVFISTPINLVLWGGSLFAIGFLFYEIFIENFFVSIAYGITWALMGEKLAWAAAMDLYAPICARVFYIMWGIMLIRWWSKGRGLKQALWDLVKKDGVD
ncbi:MAG: hypothetical protein VYB44_07140 [Bacteroidota bacterium]|nr:hypothetical protein [Bacteroidota bacterium]